jgi:hypothetical protein
MFEIGYGDAMMLIAESGHLVSCHRGNQDDLCGSSRVMQQKTTQGKATAVKL